MEFSASDMNNKFESYFLLFYCFLDFFHLFGLQKIVKHTIFSYTHPICLQFFVVIITFYYGLKSNFGFWHVFLPSHAAKSGINKVPFDGLV